MNLFYNKIKTILRFCLKQKLLYILLIGMPIVNHAQTPSQSFPFEQKSTLIIEGDKSFPPFEYLNEKGEPTGFNVELIQVIMKRLGITNYRIILKHWYEVLEDYNSGKVSLIMGMNYSESRARIYKFGASHGNIFQNVVYRRGTNPIKNISQLKNKDIIVEKQSLAHEILLENGFANHIYPTADPVEGLKSVAEGKFDAMVCNHEMGVFLIFKMGLTNLDIENIGIPSAEYRFVSPNADFLNAIGRCFSKLKADGTYDNLYNKWNNHTDVSSLSRVVYSIILLLVISALVLAIFNKVLRKRINKANRELNLQSQRITLALKAGNISVWGYNVKEKRYFNIESNIFPPEGRPFEEEILFFHPDDQENYRHTIESLSNGDTPPQRVCFRIDYTKTGHWRYIEKEFVQIRDRAGKVETIVSTHHDITELKLHKSQMDELLTKYHTVFSSTSVGLEYYDYTGVLRDMNEVTKRMFDIPNTLILLDKKLSIFDNPLIKNIIDLQSSEPISLVIKSDFERLQPYYHSKNKSGVIYLEVSINPIRDKDNTLNCYIVSYKDITEMRILQRKLQESIRKTNYAMESAEMTFWEMDTNTLMVRSYCPHNNRETNYMTTPLNDLLKNVNPNDLGVVISLLDKLKMGSNEIIKADARICSDEDESWHYYSYSATPFIIDENNHVTQYVGFKKDNTRLVQMGEDVREYNDRLNYLLRESNIQIWDYDFKSKIVTFRSSTNEIYEKLSLEEYCKLLVEPDRHEAIAVFDKMGKGEIGSSSNLRKMLYNTSNKGIRYIIFNGMPNRDNDGNIVSYFGLRRDVTKMIEIQNNLKEQMEKAKQADKLKSAFLANMSHEIRTPLNAIVGFSNLLPTTTDEAMRSKFVKLINNNNDILLRLVNDILDLSKIESGVIEIATEEMDMSLCFEETISTLRNKKMRDGVDFIAKNPYSKCIIYSDADRIAQIINNFVTNAIKYTPKGYITAGYQYIDNGIKVSVEDTGIGIPRDKQQLIFQRFEKLDNFAQGTGLGLSICKAIVDSCNGKIGFSSEKDKGSLFWAWIPCKLKEPIEYKNAQ